MAFRLCWRKKRRREKEMVGNKWYGFPTFLPDFGLF